MLVNICYYKVMKKLFVAIILILIAAFAFIIFIVLNRQTRVLSQAEKEKALANILGRKPVLSDSAAKVKYTEFKGKYISFMYPENAQRFEGAEKEGPYFDKTALESFTFSLSNPFLWTIIEVIPAPAGVYKLEDYSGVRGRQFDPGYKQSTVSANGQTGLEFNRAGNSGIEKTAIFFLNGKIYSFSVQGGDSKAVDSLFIKIISSLKFL